MTEAPWDNSPTVAPAPWDAAVPVGEPADERVPPSKPFLERMNAGVEAVKAALKAGNAAASAGIRKGFGAEPIGIAPGGEAEKVLRDLGFLTDPAKGRAGPIRMLSESITKPVAATLDTIIRGINAGVVGISSMAGKQVEQVTGDETAGKQAAREIQNLANWAMIEGGGVFAAMKMTPRGVQEFTLGQLPMVKDFAKAADVLGAPESAGLLRRLYDDHGILPSEVAMDAATDVTIIQDLARGKLPGYYVKNPKPAEGFTAYHGSPVDFENFDFSKVGSNKGDSLFGYGISVAEDASVAEKYKGARGNSMFASGDASGNVYEISLSRPKEDFLAWDAPLNAQSEATQNALRRSGLVGPDDWAKTAEEWYKSWSNPRSGDMDSAELSKMLSEAGIPGTRHSSAAAPEDVGYVIFDPKAVSGIKKLPPVDDAAPKNALVSRDATDVLDPNAPKPELNPVSYDEAKELFRSKVRSGELPKERLTFDQLYTRFVDDLNPIKVALEEAGHLNLPVAGDPYALQRLTRGSFGKADQMILNHTYKFDTYENNGRSLRDIIAPLKGDLVDWREYMIAKRSLELEERGIKSGFGVNPSRAVKEHWKDKAFEWDRIGDEIVGYQNRLTLYLRDAGVISKEGYKAMVELNKHYIPFHRFTDGSLFPRGGGRGLSARNPLKQIEGADYDILDPIDSIIRNTYAYIQIAEKNAANLQLIKLLKKWDFKPPDHLTALPKPGRFEIFAEAPSGLSPEGAALRRGADVTEEFPGPTTMAEKFRAAERSAEGAVLVEKFNAPALKDAHFIDAEFEEVFNHFGIKNPELKEFLGSVAREPNGNEIFAFENGKRVSMQTADTELLEAWRNLDRYSANELVKLMSRPAKLLRAGVTLDPAFMARNIMQDMYAALVNTKGAVFSPISTFKGARSYLAEKRGGGDVDFQNWLKGGGANGTLVSLDREHIMLNIERLNRDTSFLENAWNVVNLKKPLEGLRMLSEFLENSTRLGEFEKLAGYRRFGGDPAGTAAGKAAIQAAAMSSREVTLDFARIGSQMRAYSMITAFANAQIQGIDRFARAAKEHPFRTTAVMVGGYLAPTVYLWWANRDDPRYKRLESWEKDLYWHFMTDNYTFRIRKPLGPPGVLVAAGAERMLEAYFDKNPRALKSFGASLIASMAPGYLPTVAVPFIEHFANKSTFSDAPIVPSALMKQLPEYQYTPYTSELAKAVGGLLGAIPGVRDAATDESSSFNGVARAFTSPLVLENYLRSWTGGLGTHIKDMLDAGLRNAGVLPDPPKPEDTLEDMTFLKAFMVKNRKMTGKISDFYEENAKNEVVMNTIMAKAREGNKTAVQELVEIYGVRVKLDKVKEALNDMAAQARMIYKMPEGVNADGEKTWTPQQKRQKLDTLFLRRTEFAEYGLKILDKDRERREKMDAIKASLRNRAISQEGSLSDAPQAVPAGGGTTIRAPQEPRQQPERAGEIRLP